jgi:hypothetical protein
MLEVVRGWNTSLPQLTRPVSSNVTITLYPGRCVSLNASNEWETGCASGRKPYFVQNFSDGSDAMNDANDWGHSAIPSSTALVTALAGQPGLEFATTEYDRDQTYAIGDPVTATVANTTQATGGRLTNQGIAAGNIVGRVSRPVQRRQPDRPLMLFITPRTPTHITTGSTA